MQFTMESIDIVLTPYFTVQRKYLYDRLTN